MSGRITPPPVRGLGLNDVPLSFLPAFEAAGRLGSFASAAAELCVTPSAISQQIRSLEDALGVALFDRKGRSIELTAEGCHYLQQVRHSLSELAASTARVRRQGRGSVLRLSTVATAAHEFLLPRLPRFRARFPDIELRIESSNEVVDFSVSDFDAAIRVGSGWSDLSAHTIGMVSFALVCAPRMAAEIRSPGDLSRFTLLEPWGRGGTGAFEPLLALCGYPAPGDVWRFETCHESLLAAEHGLGVTFAPFPVASTWVLGKRLAVPLPERAPMPGSMCLVHRPIDEQRFPFAAISGWLESEYRELPALSAGRITPA